ncbi:MAG: hypothetical protein KGP28_11810 [Bdellovibrionales bacterium]|nr:hypothetical protein [Bdellovibrionales bacterium]
MKLWFHPVLFLALSIVVLPSQTRADDSYQCVISVYRGGKMVAGSDLTLSKTPEYSVSAVSTPVVPGTNGWVTLPSVDQKTGKPLSGLEFVIKTVKEESGSYHYAIEARKNLSSKPIAEVYTDSLDHKIGFKFKTMGYLHIAECGSALAPSGAPESSSVPADNTVVPAPVVSAPAAESSSSSARIETATEIATTPTVAETSNETESKTVASPYSPADLFKLKQAFQKARGSYTPSTSTGVSQ